LEIGEDSSGRVYMIDKLKSIEIVKNWMKENEMYGSFRGPYNYDEIPYSKPTVYKIFPENDGDLWFFYLQEPNPTRMLRSSTILILSKETGRIVYIGLAHDEG
jgi:hypothetical protein